MARLDSPRTIELRRRIKALEQELDVRSEQADLPGADPAALTEVESDLSDARSELAEVAIA